MTWKGVYRGPPVDGSLNLPEALFEKQLPGLGLQPRTAGILRHL